VALEKEIKNLAASVKARLLNIADQSNRNFNLILRQYVQERFLYRLANSRYSNNFILKGALLFLAFDISRLRPTRDIDFLGDSIKNDTDEIKKIFEEILLVECDDGLIFNDKSMTSENIVEDDKYHGIRVKFEARLNTAIQPIQVDIGFGDVIHKGPVQIVYPTLLDFPTPSLLAYSIESAIAEKFEAIVSLGIATSRMKDFYDILFFAQKNKFDSADLFDAINLTFNNRNTAIASRNLIFADDFKKDLQKRTQWKAFLKKNKLEVDDSFETVVTNLENFIEPLFNSVENKKWDPTKWSW